MSEQPLKLLHLPIVALRSVLQLLNPIELFELSQCSLKTTNIIPQAGSRNFKLQLNGSLDCITVNGYIFRVDEKRFQRRYPSRGNRISMQTTADVCYVSDYEIKTYWDDPYIGLATVFFQVSKVFGCPVESISSTNDMPAEVYMSIIDFISKRQPAIKELEVNGDSLTADNVKMIFDELKVTDCLEMSTKLQEVPNIPFTAKSITISYSLWITPSHLNDMKQCVVIELLRSTLTDNDMKSMLENWKQMEFPTLEYLSVKSYNLTNNFTVWRFPLRDFVNPQFYSKSVLGVTRIMYGSVDIQRGDGKDAKICYDVKDHGLQLLVL